MTHLESTMAEMYGEIKMKEDMARIKEMEKRYTELFKSVHVGLLNAEYELGKLYNSLPKDIGNQLERVAEAIDYTETMSDCLTDLHKAMEPNIKPKALFSDSLSIKLHAAQDAQEALNQLIAE